MAGIKISGLPSLSSTTLADIYPTVQSGVTYKVTLNQLIEAVSTNYACRLASTAALTATYNNGSSGVGATLTNSGALAALSIDGVSAVVDDRILIKNQASALQNGVYTVTVVGDGATAWVLTRATDYDEASDIDAGDVFTVAFGTANAKTQWIQTAAGPFTMGVTSITFESNVVAGTGILKTNNTVALNITSANSVQASTNASASAWVGPLTNGQLVIGSTGATPVAAGLTAGSGISISNGAGSITISGTGSGIGWTEVTGATQAMSADNGYIANRGTLITFTLPVTAAVGTAISVIGKGAGGWLIAQNAGQNIQIGSSSSTVGAGGSVASTNQFDSLNLICTVANLTWTTQGGPQSSGLTIV